MVIAVLLSVIMTALVLDSETAKLATSAMRRNQLTLAAFSAELRLGETLVGRACGFSLSEVDAGRRVGVNGLLRGHRLRQGLYPAVLLPNFLPV